MWEKRQQSLTPARGAWGRDISHKTTCQQCKKKGLKGVRSYVCMSVLRCKSYWCTDDKTLLVSVQEQIQNCSMWHHPFPWTAQRVRYLAMNLFPMYLNWWRQTLRDKHNQWSSVRDQYCNQHPAFKSNSPAAFTLFDTSSYVRQRRAVAKRNKVSEF